MVGSQRTRKVPQPYTSPVLVSAKLQLSPAATLTNTVPAAKCAASIAVGVDSSGFSPGGAPSLTDASSAASRRRPPCHAVSRPSALLSLTPHVTMRPSTVSATVCMPPHAMSVTCSAAASSGSKNGFLHGRGAVVCVGPRPSSPLSPPPKTKTCTAAALARSLMTAGEVASRRRRPGLARFIGGGGEGAAALRSRDSAAEAASAFFAAMRWDGAASLISRGAKVQAKSMRGMGVPLVGAVTARAALLLLEDRTDPIVK